MNILAAILYFANLKVKVTKYRILFDRLEFSTPKLCIRKPIKNYTLKCRSMLHISALIKHTHFHKRLKYSSIKNIFVIIIIINNTLFFLSILIFGSENIGQISLCAVIMVYYVVFLDHGVSFVLLFI